MCEVGLKGKKACTGRDCLTTSLLATSSCSFQGKDPLFAAGGSRVQALLHYAPSQQRYRIQHQPQEQVTSLRTTSSSQSVTELHFKALPKEMGELFNSTPSLLISTQQTLLQVQDPGCVCTWDFISSPCLQLPLSSRLGVWSTKKKQQGYFVQANGNLNGRS